MDISATYQVARKLMDEGKSEEAIVLFKQNVEIEPHFKDLELMGECLIRLGRLTEAIVPLAAATTLNKGVRAPRLLAELYLQMGNMHEAKEIAEIALSRAPNNRKSLEIHAIANQSIGLLD